MSFFAGVPGFVIFAPWPYWQNGVYQGALAHQLVRNDPQIIQADVQSDPRSQQVTLPIPNQQATSQTHENAYLRSSKPAKKKKVSYSLWSKPPRLYKRKPDRNVISNIGNQVLTEASIPGRSRDFILRCFPQLSEEHLEEYYNFAAEVKRSVRGYVNFDKLADLWLDAHPEDELNYKIMRMVCYNFVRHRLTTFIITTKKMLPSTKPFHLRARRQLLAFFRKLGT